MGRFLSVLAAVWLFATHALAAEGTPREQTLILGVVSDNPKKEAQIIKPMVNYAAGKLAEVGITAGAILIVPDKEEMVKALQQGAVDWVTDTPFPIIHFMDNTGAELLAHRWKSGVHEYHTVFVARNDGGLHTLADLLGKKIVFQDRDSSTAYYVPTAILKQHHLPLLELSSPRLTAPPDRVGFVFGRENTYNQVAWLQRNYVAAAAMSILDWREIPADTREGLKIFHESKPFPRGLEIVRKGLDPRVKQRLKEVLLHAHEDPDAAATLKTYVNTLKFDDITETVHNGLAYVRQLMKVYQGEP